jgi:N,N'-diacetyllegionaminate synthase
MTKLIAEIGWNHMGDMSLAKRMVEAAVNSGAHVAKFQTWKVERLKNGEWDNDGRRQIYEKAELTHDKHVELIEFCRQLNISFMSSVFSKPDAQMLEDLGVKGVKIPSFECANNDLIEFALDNFETVIVSTGTATKLEIEKLKNYTSHPDFHVMHCVSSYPCDISRINLPRIAFLKQHFPNVGFSDHTSDSKASQMSLQFSPSYIEKHFTVDHNLPGRDNKFAVLPEEFKSLYEFILLRNQAMTDHGIDFQDSEQSSRDFYRGRFNAS